MKNNFLLAVILSLSLASCSGYQKILQSTDYELKWTKANEYYEQKKYQYAIELFEELQSIYKGTERAEKTLFLLGSSYYNRKEYESAAIHFGTYCKTYPKGEFTEQCRFLDGKAAYLLSPDPRFSQGATMEAIDQLNVFLDLYPESDKKEEVVKMLSELQEKLAYKQVLNCRLYYNLGNYMGNNYLSCIVTASNTLLAFPTTKYREEISFLILKSRYRMALMSVDALKLERFRAAIDECYSFKNEYPESGNKKEVEKILSECKKYVKD